MRITKDTLLRGEKITEEIDAEECRISLIDCQLHRLYALKCQVEVRRCWGMNVGYTFVQLNQCKGGIVEGCFVRNTPGKTKVEDNINLFMSSKCIVRDNYIEGATPSPSYSGSGIMVDRLCKACVVSDNWVVNTHNCGIGIAGGSGNTLLRNRVYSTGPGCNGNVGLYVSNRYCRANDPKIQHPDDPFQNNGGRDNCSVWLTKDGRSDWWVPDAAFWTGNRKIKMPDLDKLREAWLGRHAYMLGRV